VLIVIALVRPLAARAKRTVVIVCGALFVVDIARVAAAARTSASRCGAGRRPAVGRVVRLRSPCRRGRRRGARRLEVDAGAPTGRHIGPALAAGRRLPCRDLRPLYYPLALGTPALDDVYIP
jgi:hypothetical protein